MSENIDEKIAELELLKETRKAKSLTEKQRAERLELMDHPFIRKKRALLREYGWKSAEKLRETMYADIEKRKAYASEDIYKAAELQMKSVDVDDPIIPSLEKLKDIVKTVLEGPEGSKTIKGILEGHKGSKRMVV